LPLLKSGNKHGEIHGEKLNVFPFIAKFRQVNCALAINLDEAIVTKGKSFHAINFAPLLW
jgi:hypothetical protein